MLRTGTFLLLKKRSAALGRRIDGLVASASSIRIVFVVAVSFCAATLGAAMLEGISNSGVLWRGHYTDISSLDLLPMCALAMLALFATFCLVVREQASLRGSLRALMYSMSRALRARSVARLVPAIVALQLVTLFTMETAEQVVVYGHSLGGSLWLGAPTAVALLAHAIIGSAGAFGVASAVALSAEHVVRIARSAFTDRVAPERPCLVMVFRLRSVRVVDHLLRSGQGSKRGPPIPAVSTT